MITSAIAAISLSESPRFPSLSRSRAVLVGYSIAGSQAPSRRSPRLNLDAEARKALHFVNEFENSGRGWFWETNAQGTLSYVSQQLADDFDA